MLTELLAFLDELLSYLESVRDVPGEEGLFADRFAVPFAIADVLLIPRSRLLKLLKGRV